MPKTAIINLKGNIKPEGYYFSEEYFTGPQPSFSLASVQAAVERAGEFDVLELDIDSGGGVIEEGWRIYDYVQTLNKPVKTKSIGMVGSMATILFLLGEDRLMSAHAKFMIHQPSGGIEGKLGDIEDYLSALKSEQQRLIDVYVRASGKDESEIADLLADRKDHEYTTQEAIAFGWATGTYSTAEKPTASFSRKLMMCHLSDMKSEAPPTVPTQTSTPIIDMTKVTSRLSAALSAAMAFLGGQPLKNLVVDTADGKKLDIESAGDTYVVGDAVKYDDGTEVPDGDYILSDGNTITVAGGTITAITEPEEDKAPEAEPAQPTAQANADEQVTISRAEFNRLSALDTEVTALKEKQTLNEAFQARVTKVMAGMQSADPVTPKLPETPADRRGQVSEDPVAAMVKERQAARKKN